MTEQQFAYWLNGFAELNEAPPTAEQWKSIREHLATVFVKVTPPIVGINPLKQHEDILRMMQNNQTVVKDQSFC